MHNLCEISLKAFHSVFFIPLLITLHYTLYKSKWMLNWSHEFLNWTKSSSGVRDNLVIPGHRSSDCLFIFFFFMFKAPLYIKEYTRLYFTGSKTIQSKVGLFFLFVCFRFNIFFVSICNPLIVTIQLIFNTFIIKSIPGEAGICCTGQKQWFSKVDFPYVRFIFLLILLSFVSLT